MHKEALVKSLKILRVNTTPKLPPANPTTVSIAPSINEPLIHPIPLI
jgi:hypothetical protein